MALKENTFHSGTELCIEILMHKCLKIFLISLKLKFSDINSPFHYNTDLLFKRICNKNMELEYHKHEVNNIICCLLLLL